MLSIVKAACYEPESYWEKRLTALHPLSLPFNQLENLVPGKGAGGKRKVAIPQEIGTLQAILPQTDVLVAAFSAFLSRFLNIDSFDIKYADTSMLANDAAAETSLKYLPLHVDLDPENTFEEVCKGMQEELSRLSEYENCFLDVLSENSDLRTALDDFERTVSISVVLVDSLEDIKSFDTKQITLIIPKYGAECMFFYDGSVLNQTRISRLLHHFALFLQGTISHPSLRISELPLLNAEDEQQLLCEFNNTKMEYPKDKLLQDLFEEQVEKTPAGDAVIFRDKKITYKKLNECSNQLARKLREEGVRPDQIVGLLVDDNSIEMTIGMISIMKAGGAFLPIDLNHPKDRIEYMLEDSNVAILITQTKLKDKIQFGGEVIYLDKQSLFTGECSNLEKINQPNDLVYVIYTSGSTGKPKGVQIEHTSIVNQIYGLKTMYTFESSLHHILLASITFDPSVQQIFLPLTTGGKLFLVPKSTKQSVKELWEFIVSNQIDIVNTVPSLMSVLLDHANSYSDLHFKYIILAGEVLSKKLYLRLKESLSAEKIINIYGPTEATINTTLYECKPEEILSTIPIGKPLKNYNIMILDAQQNLLPIDVPGEICISGVGLARGYLNNPKLTAEKFVSNPYTPGERIYRTGDLGRWTADGNIEFFGRIDHQVKIRGIRIELGEIEAVLGQHPAIQETVVIE
ncbi:MAG: amino acid adenylation domain-containing protein, partial [Thermodesulfovibrionales bacterium]